MFIPKLTAVRHTLRRGTVAVIGAGSSGLASAKALLEEGLIPIVFEQSDSLGGVWVYDEKRDESSNACAYEFLQSNSSAKMMGFSDFEMKCDSHYANHRQIVDYLREYALKYDLYQRIKFGCKVVRAIPVGNKWKVAYRCRNKSQVLWLVVDGIFVCSGQFASPKIPFFKGKSTFQGKIMHSQKVRSVSEFVDKRVLIVGAGNSGLDISIAIASVSKSTHIAIRTGVYVIPRHFDSKDIPLDQYFITRDKNNSTPEERAKDVFQFCLPTTKALVNLGFPQPKKEHPSKIQLSISKDVPLLLDHLETGRLVCKPDIDTFTSDGVTFVDGNHESYDIVILATGYNLLHFPFFDEDLVAPVGPGRMRLYKHVMHEKFDNLFFLAQSDTLGAIFVVAEMQARWAAGISSGRITKPTTAIKEEWIDEKLKEYNKRKPKFGMVIRFGPYVDDLAKDVGCFPEIDKSKESYDKLTKEPLYPSQYRLTDPNRKPQYMIKSKL